MKIEILVESDEPIIVPLDKPKIVVGAGESCDVILSSEVVSRKHAVIYVDGENFYVSDQGSTNGTFINEERLVPGKRVEFTTFFPVRLGANVLISLITDEEIAGLNDEVSKPDLKPKELILPTTKPRQEQTNMLTLKELNSVKTTDLFIEKKKNIKKKKIQNIKNKKKKKTTTNYSSFILPLVILVLGVIYQVSDFYQKDEIEATPELNTKLAIEKKKIDRKKNIVTVNSVIPEFNLLKHESLTSIFYNQECTSEQEKELCDLLSLTQLKIKVIDSSDFINIFINNEDLSIEAKNFIKIKNGELSPEENKKISEELKVIVPLLFIVKHFPNGKILPVDNKRMYNFIFYSKSDSEISISSILATYPDQFNEMKKFLTVSNLNFIKNDGLSTVSFLDRYFKIY